MLVELHIYSRHYEVILIVVKMALILFKGWVGVNTALILCLIVGRGEESPDSLFNGWVGGEVRTAPILRGGCNGQV